MSGASPSPHTVRPFTSAASVTATLHGLTVHPTPVTLPMAEGADTVLLVNKGPWAVRLLTVMGDEGTTTLAGDIEVPAHRTRLFTDPLLVTAAVWGLSALTYAGHQSTVEVHRGTVADTAPNPVFNVIG